MELQKEHNTVDLASLQKIKGPDFENIQYPAQIFDHYQSIGIQSSNFHQAVQIISKMIRWRLSDEPINENQSDHYKDPQIRNNTKCTIFLGFTSNIMSSGVREIIRYLVQNQMVSCIVTTAGGIEEDFIKCMDDFKLGSFDFDDHLLKQNGIERNGNILSAQSSFDKFEKWFVPIIKELHRQQKNDNKVFGPQKIIDYMGMKINDQNSVYYWCHQNNIPVYCPGFTDGRIGTVLWNYHEQIEQGFVVDINQDIRSMCQFAKHSMKTGAIILGGGTVKHHIFNSNIWRNGLDYTVLINTGLEYDASDSGAMLSEAITWGKVKIDSDHIKIFSEATIVFPILVALTFKKISQEL